MSVNFKHIREQQLYGMIMTAIIGADMMFIIDVTKHFLQTHKKIKYPHYINIAVSKYLENPCDVRFDIFKLLYYAGFRSDDIANIITSEQCNESREKIFMFELEYALENDDPVDYVWKRYNKSIYSYTYEYIFNDYVKRSIYENCKIKDVCSFVMSYFTDIMGTCKYNRRNPEDVEELELV